MSERTTTVNGVYPILDDEEDDHDVLLCLSTSYWGEIEIPLSEEAAKETIRELSAEVDEEDVVSLSDRSGNADEGATS